MENENDMMIIEGLPERLVVFKRGDHPWDFEYAPGDHFILDTDLMKFFAWGSDTKGSSKDRFDDGSYCDNKPNGNELVVSCYFPCPAKA